MIYKNTFKPNKKQSQLIGFRKNADYSKAEKIIAKFLSENFIEYYSEFFFKEMKVNNVTKILFFDFYIPSFMLAIEFDGEQHYTRQFNGKKIENGERNDFLKNAYCKKNNISLLRIKYTDFDNIEKIICDKFDKIAPIQ